jgi:G3E family GTPase
MKVVQIAGYLGSGKTTLVVQLGREISGAGFKVAILVNEVGEVPVDGKVIQEFGLTVKDIGGGCICCQVAGNLLHTLKLLSMGAKPDFIIIEPTGMAVPNAVRDVMKPAAGKLDLTMGPTIVLLDTGRFEKLLSYETLKRLVGVQLKDADVIALSKVDSVSAEQRIKAEAAAREINPAARVLGLSTFTREGVSEVISVMKDMVIP